MVSYIIIILYYHIYDYGQSPDKEKGVQRVTPTTG